ncbi:MAG: M14 family metallopeptidase [Pirellula sp.]|jgi:hypothetical protein|nr:M14 family metallopeptidase [Pirellula sp.]
MKANPHKNKRLFAPAALLTGFTWMLTGPTGAVAQDVPSPLSGYATFSEMEARLTKLAESPHVSLRSLGVTTGKRNVWLLTISKGEVDNRPGIAVLGNVVGAHVLGREISLQMAEQIVSSIETNPEIANLLDRFALYVIPNPTPDETEKHYRFPVSEHTGNETRTDDDRDFSTGEDPPKDLNGDGWVTTMRVQDRFASHRSHSDDGRVLVPVDSKKGEIGEYRILTEGLDADDDESFGEDAADGVAFNRNFPFNYPYFGKGAGPHQVSEIETRAVADFLYDHPNIGAVICFSPEDNLFNSWKASSQTDGARIKTKILTSDQTIQDQIAEQFRSIYPGKDAPESPMGAGSFSDWAYLHYGRWSFASRGWWVPKAAEDANKTAEASGAQEPKASPEVPPQSENKPIAKDDKRGASDLNALKWFGQQGIPAFSAWQPFDHPNLPGKKVEIGGWKPLFLLNPPHKLVGELVNPHVELIRTLALKWPQVELKEPKAVPLGKGLIEVSCEVVNVGKMPTMPEMAEVSGQWFPIQVQLHGVDGAKWIEGSPRQSVGRLKELGGTKEIRWLFLLPSEVSPPGQLKITVSAPTILPVEQSLEVK